MPKSKSKKIVKDDTIFLNQSRGSKILYWTLQSITVLTMVASIIMYFVSASELEVTVMQVFMCIFALLIFNVPIFLERRFKLYIPNYISIILYVLIFSHFILGEIFRAYDHSPLFDKILHTTSGVIIALLGFSIVSVLNALPRTKFKLSPLFLVIFAFCFTMTSEYLWELFEYGMDTFFGMNMQRWQDSFILGDATAFPKPGLVGEFLVTTPRGNAISDTMGDMAVNVLGALGVCIYAYVGMKLRPNWVIGRVLLTKEDVDALRQDGTVKIAIDNTSEEILITKGGDLQLDLNAIDNIKTQNEEKEFLVMTQTKESEVFHQVSTEEKVPKMSKSTTNKAAKPNNNDNKPK